MQNIADEGTASPPKVRAAGSKIGSLTTSQPLLTRINWKYVGYGLGLVLLFRYFFIYLVVLSSGFALVCAGLIYYIFSSKPHEGYRVDYRREFKKFTFTEKNNWSSGLEAMSMDEKFLSQPVFEESFLISETFDEFLNLIIQNFVTSWYQNISTKTLFINSLKSELKGVSLKFKERLNNVDFSELIVLRILPIITEHFNQYIKAEEIARSKSNIRIFTMSSELDFAIASHYNRGKLHPAVSLKSSSYDSYSKDYLRKKVDQLLPYILSENESNFRPVSIISREIIACTVISNVLSMFSDGDYYNQLIVKVIGKTLKDRTQVKQFRAALEEHSNSNQQSGKNRKISSDFVITRNMDSTTFKKKFNNITEMTSLPELKQLKYYTSVQLNKVSHSRSDEVEKVYSKRLQLVQITIDQKILQATNPNRSTDSVTSSAGNSLVLRQKNLDLKQILDEPLPLSYFMEFMEQRQRTVLLQFWLTVNGIKNPLEDNFYDDNDNDGDGDLEEVGMSTSLDMSGSDDIKQIFNAFFSKSLLRIDDSIYHSVESFLLSDTPSIDSYMKARRSILKLQNNVFERMNTRDLQSFRRSDFFFKLLATDNLSQSSSLVNQSMDTDVSESDFNDTESPHSDNDALYEEENDPENDEVSPLVVKAVEDALNEIMNTQNKPELPKVESSGSISSVSSSELFGFDSSFGSSKKQNSVLHKNLFGEGSELFADENKTNKLFDDYSDSENDNESIITENEGSPAPSIIENGSELHLAAPGDLSLTEEVSRLSMEIERLTDQQNILEPLLKKAELTNNIAELRILKKSKISLEREIQIKELQKQQYVVQENDNSLFGKSRVRIQSYINGSENGREFILYMIEVQKLSNEEQNIVTAGWMVARRFSHFYKLNEYLKSRYPDIANIKFPKRTVVLKFQQQQVVDSRKNGLEEYLQHLIRIPEICSNKAFRSFLSSENFSIEKNEPFDDGGNYRRKSNIELVANKLYSGLSNRLYTSPTPLVLTDSNDGNIDEKVKEMQNELSSYDDQGKVSFVKPISDLLISLFRLNRSNSWLRGRAVLVVLQQIFGTTIEKKFKENIGMFKTEEKILDIVISLKDSLFPEGIFRKSSTPRTSLEKSSTKQESKVLLETLMVEPSARIFGSSNSKFAVNKMFNMFQNDVLNKNLVFEIFDEIINELFPEINEK